jgi:iron complex transport system substrate-binding protein
LLISLGVSAGEQVIENCSFDVAVSSPPRKSVTLNQAATEVMLSLGLENQMVGTAYLDDEIWPDFKAAYDRIPVIAKRYPNKEAILALDPDFIYGGFASAFTDRAAGDRHALKALGIHSYLTPVHCPVEPQTPISTDDVLREFLEIGHIFQIDERAIQLVEELKRRLDQVQKTIAAIKTPKRVFLFDSNLQTPYTGGAFGIQQLLITLAGGENVFEDVEKVMAHVAWEAVIDRNPEVIILIDALWSTAEEKRKFLKENPALSEVTAIKNQAFCVLPFSQTMPGIRMPVAVNTLARFLYPEQFKAN